MGSNYLLGVTDGYGLPATLAPGLAELASSIVDAYLKRPEGLVYITDGNGNPCAMQAVSPTFTYTLQGSLSPGTNVAVTVLPALVKPDLIGEVLVIDFGVPNIVEACTVVSTTGNNQIVLGTVQFAHASQAKADVGRVITEDRNAPSKRSIVRIAKWPIVNVISMLGRYAYGRRSDQIGGLYQEMNLLAAVQTFGGPPQWIPIPINQSSWSDATGEIWVPAGLLLAYYSDVRVRYVAGYPTAPDPVVRATAKIANDLSLLSGIAGQVKIISAGDTRITKFSASTIDQDVKDLLEPYRARTMF